MVDLTRGVVIRRWVRRREPFSDIQPFLIPCGRVSVFTTQGMEVADYEHFISFILFAIPKLAFLISRRTKVRRNMGEGSIRMRTVFELTSGLHILSCRHPDQFLYQAI